MICTCYIQCLAPIEEDCRLVQTYYYEHEPLNNVLLFYRVFQILNVVCGHIDLLENITFFLVVLGLFLNFEMYFQYDKIQ